MKVWLAAAGCAAVAAWAVWTFNRFVQFRNRLREAWSGIDVQLKRRHDLVPPLVEAVRAYRAHEREALEAVTGARTRALTAAGPGQTGEVETDLARQMRALLAVAEAYPALKADANFRQLSASLIEIEDQLQYARRYYNGTVRDLNNLAEKLPSRLIATLFAFRSQAFFEVESAIERQAPGVKL